MWRDEIVDKNGEGEFLGLSFLDFDRARDDAAAVVGVADRELGDFSRGGVFVAS